MRAELPADGSVHYEGNAGSLREALSNMAQNLAIALIALFLLLAALFRSVKDSLYVILTIPLASFGGVLALVLLRLFTPQTLDLLTMVGFVVLMGLVVNNAILLVDQARSEIRAGATVRAAVESSLATRTRPIMLTTLTTLFGMLPLVLVPGPGSVLYRGLGTVLVGGMAVNSVFTLVLLPDAAAPHRKTRHSDRGGNPTNNPWKPYETHPRLHRACSARWPAARQSSPPMRRRCRWWSPRRARRTSAQASRPPARWSAATTRASPAKSAARSPGSPSPASAVKRGATIARIDPERLALTLRDNDAALKRLEAQLSLLATQRARLQTLGNVVSQSQLDEALSRERMAEQDVEQARVARDRARLDVNRAVGARAVRRRSSPSGCSSPANSWRAVRRCCGS